MKVGVPDCTRAFSLANFDVQMVRKNLIALLIVNFAVPAMRLLC